MLAIRLQRTGRKGLALYRVIVQEAQRSPKSERIVARLGHYNPHTKELSLDKEKTKFYLKHGAQPSERIIKILKAEKVNLPAWVPKLEKYQGKIKNSEKLRKNRPAEPEQTQDKDAAAPEASKEDKPEDQPSAASGEGASAEEAEKEDASADKEDSGSSEKPADTSAKPDKDSPEEEQPKDEPAAEEKPAKGQTDEKSEAKEPNKTE